MGAAHILEGHNARMTLVQHFYLTSDISSFDSGRALIGSQDSVIEVDDEERG